MTRPAALITMATGYVGPALARPMADRGVDLVLHGMTDSDSMDELAHVTAPLLDGRNRFQTGQFFDFRADGRLSSRREPSHESQG